MVPFNSDGSVKSPISKLRFISRHCGVLGCVSLLEIRKLFPKALYESGNFRFDLFFEKVHFGLYEPDSQNKANDPNNEQDGYGEIVNLSDF